MRRLNSIIYRYGEANEENEMDFSQDVSMLISQIEIYDQIWYGRHMPDEGEHSAKAQNLVREFIERLEEIPDGCAETFPFEMIDELRMAGCTVTGIGGRSATEHQIKVVTVRRASNAHKHNKFTIL